MRKLTDILKNTPVREVHGDADIAVAGLVYDSRAVKPGDCFFAVPGTQSDGHDYIPMAVEKGAAAIVCERMPADAAEGVAYVLVGDSAGAMADMAAAFYDYPSRELKLVGITGTNGKTTTATLLYDLVRAMGYKAGLISTVVYKIDGREVEATHTTPDSIRLNAMMREMADAGCAYCFMECSSHAIVQERTRGLDFAGGIFSNITHDHLDYHKTFAEYIRAKKLFFDGLPKGAFALTNADDRNGRVMVQNTAAAVSAYSLRAMADFRCKIVEMHVDGMLLRIDGQELWVGLLGRFNAYNLLAVYGAAALLGLYFHRAWSAGMSFTRLLGYAVLCQVLTVAAGLLFVALLLGIFWLAHKLGHIEGERWEQYFQSVSTAGLLLRVGAVMAVALAAVAALSVPLFARLGFQEPGLLAALFFVARGAYLLNKFSRRRDELIQKLLKLKR